MKSMIIFIDMLSGYRLHLCNKNETKKSIEGTLEELGGTVFTNCFTPCPDTPRSTASVWTGVMPKKNNCNTRVKYPRFYLNSDIDNIWEMCIRFGMEINLFLPPIYVDEGMLPAGIEKKVILTQNADLATYLKGLHPSDHSMTGFFLQDFHRALDDTGYVSGKNYKAYELIDRELKMIFKSVDIKSFDAVIIYSDHGWADFEDGKKEKVGPEIINRDRAQIYLQIYRKGESAINFDGRLSTTLDIFPTFANIINEKPKNSVDGLDLFSNRLHKSIVIEDHAKFTSNIGQLLEYWGIVDDYGISVTDFYGNWWPENIDDERRKEYEQVLNENACEYSESVKFIQVMARYKNAQDVDVYDTMERRIKEKPSIVKKLKRRIRNISEGRR